MTAAQDEGEWRRTAEQGAECFMAKWMDGSIAPLLQRKPGSINSMPERDDDDDGDDDDDEDDGKDQGEDSPKQAGSCWFARHS